MNYAIIEDGVVANIAASDSPLAPNWVQSDAAAIGDLYDGATFAKPAALPPTREALKAQREAAVAAIKVTTQAGNTFDGDETSQNRMTRAITALMAVGGTVTWVLADNTVIQADAAELTEALALAGAAQAAIWVI
jgi:biopolymer transport protein ExbD